MAKRARTAIAVLSVLLVAGCAHWPPWRGDPVTRLLKEGDARFDARADPTELDAAIDLYLQARGEEPDSARVLYRLARALTVRGYAHPEGTSADLETAREYGVRCLRGSAAFSGAVDAAGGIVQPRAVEAVVGADLSGCLLWTGLAWARWLEARDVAGAAIDLPVVVALAQRATDLMAPARAGLRESTLGLARALATQPDEAELAVAEGLLKRAMALAPQDLSVRVDLAVHVYGARGDDVRWRATLDAVVAARPDPSNTEYLENQRAQARASAALAQGLSTTWWRAPEGPVSPQD